VLPLDRWWVIGLFVAFGYFFKKSCLDTIAKAITRQPDLDKLKKQGHRVFLAKLKMYRDELA